MGFIKSVLREVGHVVEYAAGHLLADAPGRAAGHPLLLVSVDEVGPLLLHDGLLLLAHGPAHQVAAAQGVAAQIPDDLHHLLLVDDTAVGGGQDGLQLRAGIDYILVVIFSLDVFRDEVHGPGAVQGDACDDVLQVLGAQLFHEAPHPAAFQLEHAVRLPGAYGCQDLGVIVVDAVDVDALPLGLLHEPHCVRYHRQRPQAQEIHFQQAQLLQGGHGELCGDGAVAPPGQGHEVVRRLRADDHPRRVHGGMPGQALQASAHVDQVAHLLVLLIGLAQLRVLFQGFVDGDVQLGRYHLRDGVHEGIGQVHDPAHVPDDALGRQRTESDNLHHLVGAVLPVHIVNDLLPAVVAEVDVDIGHGHPLRVQEPLEEQVVPDGLDVGDLQAVGHDAPRGGASARPYGDAVAPGVIDEIPHDQEVVHIPHAADDAKLVVKPLLQGLSRVPGGLCPVPVALRKPVAAQLVKIAPGVVAFRHLEMGELGDSEFYLHMAAVRDALGVLQCFPGIGEQGLHLLLALDEILAPLVAQPVLVRQLLVGLEAQEDVVGVRVLLVGVVDIVGGH